jgi:hypothetical protein
LDDQRRSRDSVVDGRNLGLEVEHQRERQVVDEPGAQVAPDGGGLQVAGLDRRRHARLHLPDPAVAEPLRPEPDEVGVVQQAAEREPVHRGLLQVLAEDEVRCQQMHQDDQRRCRGRECEDARELAGHGSIRAGIEHRDVEGFLAGKVLVEEGLGDPRRARQLSCGGAVEALLGKRSLDGGHDGLAPFLGREPRPLAHLSR